MHKYAFPSISVVVSSLDGQSTGSSDEDEGGWVDSWLVTGGSDSSLRKWIAKTCRPLERATIDEARERIRVWAVGVLGFVGYCLTCMSAEVILVTRRLFPETRSEL